MMTQRRRVLYLAYWVPPRNAIGTVRSSHILRHLPDFGWDVDVVTARLDSARSNTPSPWMQTGYWDVKRAIKRLAGIGDKSTSQTLNLHATHYGGTGGFIARAVRTVADFVTYPDDCAGWLPFAVGPVRRLLRSGKYDALLTSSPPVTTNVIAALAHRDVPWIADLRDLWAENDSSERSFMERLFDERLERAALARASALIASSRRSAERFRKRYPSQPCSAISTGFDPDEWLTVDFGTETPCTLVHAGNFYRGKRDPRLFFRALREILDEGSVSPSDVRVDFYADREPWLDEAISAYGLREIVNVHGTVERAAVLAAERRADRLLVFSWDGPTAEGIVPGKLFEYFGARRPILSIGGTKESAVRDLLDETGAGVRCLTKEEVKRELLAALAEHRNGRRVLPEESVRRYTGRECAASFAAVLDSAVRRRF